MTRYENMIELENFTLYFLLSHKLYANLHDENPLNAYSVCFYLDSSTPGCEIMLRLPSDVIYYTDKLDQLRSKCNLGDKDGSNCPSSEAQSDIERRIRTLCGLYNTVFISSHDPEAVEEAIRSEKTLLSSPTTTSFAPIGKFLPAS